jgi:DNA-binding transcriptional LysR family regulator
MEQRHLTFFLAAADELNFTRAAAEVFTTQSSLSRSIQDLERELDVQLFDRSTSPLTLTPAGTTLRREARALVDHMERVVDRVRSVARPADTLVVGCLPDLPFQLLPDAIRRFRERLPGVTVRLKMMAPDELDRAVADGSVDIAFSWDLPRQGDVVGEFEIGLMMPRAHPLARQQGLAPADVRHESLIVVGDETGVPLHERLGSTWPGGPTQPIIVQGVERWEDGRGLVAAGLGVMLVPVQSANRFDQSGVLVRSFSPALTAEVWLSWETGRADRRIEAFRAAVRTATRATALEPVGGRVHALS